MDLTTPTSERMFGKSTQILDAGSLARDLGMLTVEKYASIFIGLVASDCNFRLMKDRSTDVCIRDKLLQQTPSPD